MSDFDREAERRKLEEKYGQEEADRERTERLSELLLKGATMTDIHCPECGDPIFRHEGRQFCPSCQREVASGEGEQATAGQAAAQDPTTPDTDEPEPTTDGHSVEVETPESGAEQDDGTEADSGGGEADSDTAQSSAQSDQSSTAQPPTQPPTQQPPQTPQTPSQSASGPSAQMPSSGGSAGTGGTASGLMPARQHLTRTVNRLAEQAAAEEDPGRKREFLAATREAAEALEAVRNAE